MGKAIHVGNHKYNGSSSIVWDQMYNDIAQTIRPKLKALLESKSNYKVMIYHGQLDFELPFTGMEAFLQDFKWKGQSEYLKTARTFWKVDGAIAGYAKEVQNFKFILVRSAGHMVPLDQPKHALDLITRFI